MRKQLGLPVPEVETGRAAHDLVGLLGAGRVVLTRAAKSGSAPTVRSRWVERVLALAESLGSREALRPAQPWLDWARAKSRVEPAPPIRPPSPRPALDLRPRRATVSDVETWIRNPYALYAQRILRLKPLPRLGAEPGPVERGIMLHQALAEFAREHPGSLPADVAAQVMGFANEVVREMTGVPSVAAFWLPRLERFAEWFAETEPARRANGVSTRVEIDGALEIEAPCGTFTLAARADRIDLVGGAARIFDYKTGKPPSWKQVEAGFRPQLPLEAAMLAAGAFADVPAIPVESLGFIGASGGEPAGIDSRKAGDRAAIAAIAEAAIAGLRKLVAEYDTAAKDYAVLRRPNMNYDYDDYAHLARIDEWRGQQGGEGA
jgi:ATP-dependent helicase/nuclease subunit B